MAQGCTLRGTQMLGFELSNVTAAVTLSPKPPVPVLLALQYVTPSTVPLPGDWLQIHFLPPVTEHQFCFLEQGYVPGFHLKKALGKLSTQLSGRALA